MQQSNNEVFEKLYKIIKPIVTINPDFFYFEEDNDIDFIHEGENVGNVYQSAKDEYENAQKELKSLFTPALCEDDLNELEDYIKSLFKSKKKNIGDSNIELNYIQSYWWNSEISKSYSHEYIENSKKEDINDIISVASTIENTLLKYANDKVDTAVNVIDELEKNEKVPAYNALQKVPSAESNDEYFYPKYDKFEVESIIFEVRALLIKNKEEALIKLLRYMDNQYDIPKISIDNIDYDNDSKASVKNKQLIKNISNN